MHRVAAALLSLCAAAVAAGAPAPGQQPPGVSARAKGRRSVVVSERGRARPLDLAKHIDAARIEDVSVTFLTRAGGFAYLVLDVCGLSKLPPDDRQCGAGIECNVVWLKLDARWRVVEGQNVRYESCWSSVSSEGPKVAGRRLTLSLEDFRADVRREVAYDADRPEQGLRVAQSPLPKSNP